MNTQKILEDSWGYDMTINDYALVLKETDKTAECVMIATKVLNDDGLGGGKSIPDPDKIISEPFRLRIKKWDDNFIQYRGSYQFTPGSKRFGRFAQWDGKPSYYNTWD